MLLLLSLLLYRDLSWKRFCDAIIEAGIATGVVMLVIMGSSVIGWLLTFDQVPTRFAEWVAATIQNKYLVIFALNILMLLVGMPLDLSRRTCSTFRSTSAVYIRCRRHWPTSSQCRPSLALRTQRPLFGSASPDYSY